MKIGLEIQEMRAKMGTRGLNIKKPTEEVGKISQSKSDFISTINHELRTPLTISKEGVSIILDKIIGNINEEQERVLIIAKNNLDRLAQIIDKLPEAILQYLESI